MISFDIKIGKEDNGSVSRYENQDMENAMEIWKTNAWPGFAIQPIIYPTEDSSRPKNDAPMS